MPNLPTFVLTITLSPGEPIRVEGPLMDKDLCYMMLFQAAIAIKNHEPDKIIQTGLLSFDPSKFPQGGRG